MRERLEPDECDPKSCRRRLERQRSRVAVDSAVVDEVRVGRTTVRRDGGADGALHVIRGDDSCVVMSAAVGVVPAGLISRPEAGLREPRVGVRRRDHREAGRTEDRDRHSGSAGVERAEVDDDGRIRCRELRVRRLLRRVPVLLRGRGVVHGDVIERDAAGAEADLLEGERDRVHDTPAVGRRAALKRQARHDLDPCRRKRKRPLSDPQCDQTGRDDVRMRSSATAEPAPQSGRPRRGLRRSEREHDVRVRRIASRGADIRGIDAIAVTELGAARDCSVPSAANVYDRSHREDAVRKV